MAFCIIETMRSHNGIISEMLHINEETCLILKGHPGLEGKAGQFLQAFGEDPEELLPTLLYPCGMDSQGPLWCGAIPKSWQPGDTIRYRGPRGNGFHLPPLARRVVLTCLDEISINRLLPLADLALQNGAEVTILSDRQMTALHPAIELLGLVDMAAAFGWADYAGLVLQPRKLTDFGRNLKSEPPAACEVMLDTPMVCDESSACGVCSVLTSKGSKLICKDGPVFNLADLLNLEAGYG